MAQTQARAQDVEPKNPPASAAPPSAARQQPGTALEVVDLGDDAGAGLEDMRIEEQLTPFLRMLQSNSPQLNPNKPEYIPDARQGMILNTATGEVYDGKEGIDVVVCARDYHYGMWVPRGQDGGGGGFRGMRPATDSDVRRLVGKHGKFRKLPFEIETDGRREAIEMVETGQLIALYGPPGRLDDSTAQPAIIAFSSTGMPVYQGFITRHASWKWRQPDETMKPAQLWAYRWRLRTVPQSNAKGDFYNWKIDLAPPAANPREALMNRTSGLYQMAVGFHKQFIEGMLKPDYESAGPEREPGQDDDEPGF